MTRTLDTVTGALLLSLALAVPALGEFEPAPARSADAFVDSIGVNIHMHYTNTPYVHFEKWKPLLLELGIRHVRDGMVVDSNWRPYYDRHAALAEAGVSGTFIVHLGTDVERVLPTARRLPNLIAFEGTNEPDIFHTRREDWPGDTRRLQQQLHQAVRGDEDYAAYPIIAPSLVHAASYEKVGDLSDYADFGNIHPYPGARRPWQRVDRDSQLARHVSGDLPLQATETGYQTALATDDGHQPSSERAKAVYLPRLFFEYFDRGIVRTFDYEFISTFQKGFKDIESNFGFLHYEPDIGEFRLARHYHVMQRLIALLQDPGDDFEPGSLTFALEHSGGTLRHALLQKRDGRFYLALWLDESVWDVAERRDRFVEAQPVSVIFDSAVQTAVVHRPTYRAEPLDGFENTHRIELDVPADVLILELTP